MHACYSMSEVSTVPQWGFEPWTCRPKPYPLSILNKYIRLEYNVKAEISLGTEL